MRTSNKKLYLAACLVAPLFACGSESTGGVQVKLPDNCTNGQVLTTDANGQLVCTSLPVGSQKLPECQPFVEALTSEDGSSVKCVARNNENAGGADAVKAVNQVSSTLSMINTTVNNLLGSRQTYGVYKGLSTAKTTGNISSNGKSGILGAADICTAQYGAGSYMCSVYDMYMNVARGKIAQTDTVAKSWVYMTSWKPIAGGALNVGQGLNDNCASFTSGATTGYWGTAFEWTALSNGSKGLKFSAGPNATQTNSAQCSDSLPIACCQ